MAHFRAVIQGNRGESSRLGSKASGIDASVNGWTCGVAVRAAYDPITDSDYFKIFRTTGSNGGRVEYIGEVREGKFIPHEEDKE
jgi:hypothetical protein